MHHPQTPFNLPTSTYFEAQENAVGWNMRRFLHVWNVLVTDDQKYQKAETKKPKESSGILVQYQTPFGRASNETQSYSSLTDSTIAGPLLRSLLLLQGIPDPYGHYDRSTLQALVPSKEAIENDCTSWAQHLHLHLQSAQPTSESDKPCGDFFGASIPLSVALHPSQQSIIATHLNGCILPQQHGYPLRIVLPGHVGARWVKWLSALRISPNANDSPPMRLDYKIIERPQNVSVEEEKRWKAKISGQEMDTEFRKEVLSRIAPIQTLGVGSSIEVPTEGTTFPLETKTIKVKGYATGQYGECIVVGKTLG